MLGKFLPFLDREPKQKLEPRLPNSPLDLVGDDLVTPESVPDRILNGYFYFIVIIFVIFLILFSINLGYKSLLDKQKIRQEELVNNLINLNAKKDRVISVNKKTSFYKNSLDLRKTLFDKTKFVTEKINPQLRVVSVSVDDKRFKLSLVGENIYLFTQLIMAYLEDKSVSEISIISATLKTQTQEFTVELSGVFK